MTRGVLYMAWEGDERTESVLQRSIRALEETNPELSYTVQRCDPSDGLLNKARMLDLTPYDTTLYLDADTVPLGNLDFAFDKAELHGLACCICECPWARRYPSLAERGDVIEYNSGVLAFTIGAEEVFDEWQSNANIDSSIRFLNTEGEINLMPHNDQAAFAMAIDDTGFNPFVLPLNWNFRPQWQLTAFGPVRIWHCYRDVPDSVYRWNDLHPDHDRVISCGRFDK